MKVLITGGNGFIGQRLVPKLMESHDVFILGNEESGLPNYILKDIRDPGLDLSPYGAVFHLAAISLPGAVENDREKAWDINVNGTMNIAKKLGKGQRLIFMSSAHVYERMIQAPHKEEEAPSPNNFYGLTKAVGEQVIDFYSKDRGFGEIIFRLFNSYSKDQQPGLLVGDVIKKYREEETIKVFNPDAILDMVHIDDVVTVLSKCLDFESGTYNLCSGHAISISEIYEKIGKHAGAEKKRKEIVSDKKGMMLGDNSKIRQKGFSFRKFSLD